MPAATGSGERQRHRHEFSEHAHEFSEHAHGDSAYRHATRRGASAPLILAVLLTGGYAVVELVGGLWSGSLALVADSGHLATDAFALGFSLAANLVAQRPASERHSYGLARAEVIAAFVNSLVLLGVVAWLVFEAIARVAQPVGVRGQAMFTIAAIGMVVNLVVAWVLSRDRDNVNIRAALLHVLGDLLGSIAALVAGAVIFFTGYTVVDPLVSMLVSGLILRSTVGVLRETTLVLLDSVPAGVDYQRVGQALASIDGVVSVHDLHIWSMVPGRTAVSAHLLVDRIERWPVILRQARQILSRGFNIDHATLQPEWLRRQRGGEAIKIQPAA